MSLSLRLKSSGIGPSKGRAVYEKVRGDKSIINMAAGEPSFDTPAHIRKAAADAADRGETHYAPTQGLAPLREAIARRYQNRYGVTVKPAEIQITSGAANAVFLAVHSLVGPGDREMEGRGVTSGSAHWMGWRGAGHGVLWSGPCVPTLVPAAQGNFPSHAARRGPRS